MVMHLSVITRSDYASVGKPRIFISCYKNNNRIYSETIASWILKIRNYAVYYPMCDGNHNQEEENLVLEQMQCFVIPIFPKDKEFDKTSLENFHYAKKHNIPVFIVLMDGTCDKQLFEQFEALYGKVQMMSPYDNDPTKLPFIQQLEHFFRDTIHDDLENYQIYQAEGIFDKEIKKEISFAFRGNIFLSYRKKNRKNLNEIVSILHSNNRLVDIMLWYDEYLLPGEIYTDILQEQIQNADIVLLVVTPDIFENENYVLVNEYPKAVEFGKMILAVEAEPVDEQKLRSYYPELDFFFRRDDFKYLSDILAEYFEKDKGCQKKIEGKRAYILGKAYYEGLWVETNRERGLQYIQNAANDNYIPAIKWMINAYKFGNGVDADPKQQLFWQKKLEDVSEHALEKCKVGTTINENELFHSYEQKGDLYLKEGEFHNALEAYELMLKYACQIYDKSGEFLKSASISYVIHSYYKVANVNRYIGDYESAKNNLEKAISLYNTEKSSEISLGGVSIISSIWKLYGMLEYDRRNYKKAISCFDKSKEYLSTGVTLHVLSKAELQLKCENLEFLGRIYKDYNDLNQSYQYYMEFLNAALQYEKEYPDSIDVLKCVMRAYTAIGELFILNNHLDDALTYYQKALCYAEIVEKGESSMASRQDMINSYIDLGKTYYMKKAYSDAWNLFRKAVSVIEEYKLHNNPSLNFIDLYSFMGNIMYIKNMQACARDYYEKMVHYAKEKFERERTLQSLQVLGGSYYKLATTNVYLNDWNSINNAERIYQILYRETNDERIGELYKKIFRLKNERSEQRKINRAKISRYTDYVWNASKQLDNVGIRCSDDTCMTYRIQADIIEMLLALIDKNAIDMSWLSRFLNLYAEMDISESELNSYFLTKSILMDGDMPGFLENIPKSIIVSSALMKKIGSGDDYHDGYPFAIRIILYILGDWIIEQVGNDEDRNNQFVKFINKIDSYIESEFATS